MSYEIQHEGEWVRPVKEGFKLECCSCGYTHTFNFRIVEGQIEYQVFVDKRATAQKRRRRFEKVEKP